MSRTVTITLAEYEELLERSDFLECLQACGVDNWSGYDDAVEMFQSEEPSVVTTTTTSSIAVDSGYTGFVDPLLDVLVAEEIVEDIIEDEEGDWY